MKTKRLIDVVPINRPGYSTRATQSIQQYGPGAMVDFPDQTLMAADPFFWRQSVTHIHDPRLEKALGVKYFGMPGTDSDNNATKAGISYVRFPEYYFCPVCRRMKKLSEWQKEHEKYANDAIKSRDEYMVQHPKCYKDHCPLVAAAIVTVCDKGHINDFPWVEWAHYKNTNKATANRVCSNPDIIFTTGNSATEGVRGLKVTCKTCKATATLGDAFNPDIFKTLVEEKGIEAFYCQGNHPWKGTKSICTQYPVVKQRGDSNVYFSCTASSIVLPANIDANTNKIVESQNYKRINIILSDCEDEEEREDTINSKLQKWSEKTAEETHISVVTVRNILKNLLQNEDEGQSSYGLNNLEYKFEEFCALSGINKISGSEDFQIEEMDIEKYDIPGVSQVVLVKKLKEVQALVGFSRLQPLSISEMDDPHFVSIKRLEEDWYPGFEVRGEGIFIQFNLDELEKWADSDFAIRRQEMALFNLENSTMRNRIDEIIDSRYILLHTLSHLLIKQLSFECGYNIASLRERIYYMPPKDEDTKMAGILIYTASGDSEGTLGGLVRQGREDCFPRIFKEALEHALLCSNDPVCITSNGQGRESLNLAACHSCALLPETSCEVYNIMLDRALVIGTFEEPNGGFYSKWINNSSN